MVGAHFGRTPKKYQSGETDYTGRISKIGDAGLRKATVALARKLAVVPHKMLRDQTDFAAHQAKPMMAA